MSDTAEFDLDRVGGNRMLRLLIDEILAAGSEARLLYRGNHAIRWDSKPDMSPVTAADRAVESRLRLFFETHCPDASFLGEESGVREGDVNLRWVVDPIDGTRAFIRGLPTWSILVGLEADGVPALGIAYMPALGELFVGRLGGGALINGRPVHLSKTSSLDCSLVSHGGLAQFVDGQCEEVLGKLARNTFTQRGYADFDGYRQLLLGRVDAMVDPAIQPYDVCPAAVLIREAGGTFTDMKGEATIHGGSGLASNGLVHDELLALLND